MKITDVLRTISIWVFGLMATIITVVLSVPLWLLDPFKQRLVQAWIRLWGRTLIFFAFVKITVLGRENLEGVKSAVFVANHQSMLDIFAMLGYIPRATGFLAKRQLLYIPVIGHLMQLYGHILVDRSNPRAAMRSVKTCIAQVKKGWSINIFPEGTRTLDGSIAPFKSGSLKIPLRTKAPVVPVTIAGAYKILPKKKLRVKNGHIVMHIGKPMATDSLNVRTFRPFVDSVEQKIREQYQILTTEYPETAPESNPEDN